MAFVGRVTIRTSANITRMLSEAAPAVARKHLRKALRAGAVLIRDEAKRTAPVFQGVYSDNRLGGGIKKSIRVRAGKARGGQWWRAVVLVQTRDGDFSGDEFYAAFLEYGTKERTQKSTGRKVGRAPQLEFMKRAFEAKRSQAEAIISARLYSSVMKELGGTS